MSAMRAVHVGVQRGEATLLRDVSLDIAYGAFTALIGPNGAGKSTLLGVLAGDIDVDTGSVFVDDEPLSQLTHRVRARRRAVLPQQTILQFGFTSYEVVQMGRTPLPAELRQHDHEAVLSALAETETSDLEYRRFPTLSGGEQTRVNISRILVQEAPVILLDEPTAALDIRHQIMVMETATTIARNGGAVLAVLHDLNLAMMYADVIGLLDHGRMIAVGTPQEVAKSDLLSDIFKQDLVVTNHPFADRPLILTRPNTPQPRDQE